MRFAPKTYVAVYRIAEKTVSHSGWQKALKNLRSSSPAIFIYSLNDSLLLFNADPVNVFAITASLKEMFYIEN